MFCRLLAVALLVSVGCRDALDRPIEFVFPENFEGPFVVIEHPDYPDRLEVHADRYEFHVPADGIVRTRDAWVLRDWHQSNVLGGSTTIYGDSGPRTPVVNWFYVGERDDFEAFFHVHDASELETKWLSERGILRADLNGDNPPP